MLTGIIDTDPEAEGEGELIGEVGGVGVLEIGGDDFRDEGAIGAVWGEREVREAGLVDGAAGGLDIWEEG